MKTTESNSSATAEAMGAKISIKGPPRAMYLVVGNDKTDVLVAHAGGQITLRCTADKVLAVLTYEGYLSLNRDSRIFRIGPVNLDMERLKRFSRSFSQTVAPTSGTTSVH